LGTRDYIGKAAALDFAQKSPSRWSLGSERKLAQMGICYLSAASADGLIVVFLAQIAGERKRTGLRPREWVES
jgi:hypothetical protein